MGLGVTVASTFAPALGLSVTQQRIGFAFGVVLMAVGVALFSLGQKSDRQVPAQDHVVLPPRESVSAQVDMGDGEFGRRDDRGELAQRCHMLAASIERWVEAFNSGHSQRAEKYVREWLEADTGTDPAEARKKAYTRDEKQWELDYRLKYQDEAAKLFRQAWEMGEVAKEHEQLATAPLAIQFEEVPRLFNTIADRLYGEG